MPTRILAAACAAILAVSVADAGRAENGAPPAGEVILTVTLSGDAADDSKALQFDREALTDLGLVSIETTTIWTDGVQTFEGVPLTALMDFLQVDKGTLLASATNDYTVEVPVSDAVDDGPIIAMNLNGERMSLRDKGPLWIVYPYDAFSKYRTEVIYSRSIWQLDRLKVVE